MAVGGRQGGGRITQASIDMVLQRSDLVDLAGGFTQLHKRGAEFSGRCPFHDERTPSFWVNQTKGVYHCFGCGASGDVIKFVQQKQGLDFVEAVDLLADRYRVELEYEEGGSGKPRQSKRRLYEASDAAAAFFESALWSAASAEHVRDYLAERNIAPDTARAFRLGYSPEGDVLKGKAMQRGFTKEELVEARLISDNGRDFFHGRLMVPIIDRAKRVIGFGARKLREEQYGGKYMNSRSGVLFDKSRNVYLAPGIADAARTSGFVVVVEGYMDVIAMWQAGMRNVCAVMGTAVTEDQVVELKRIAPRAVFALDPDPAGQAATVRALEKAHQHDLDVRVALLPEGEDPADVLASEGGRARMEAMLEAGVSLLHFRTSALLASGDLSDASERDRIYRDAIQIFRGTADGPARREQIKRVENALQLDTAEAVDFQAQTGGDAPMRMTRQDSWEPKYRGERAVRDRVASTGAHSTAVAREKRLLAAVLRLAEVDPAIEVAGLLPPERSFALGIHRRAHALLTTDGAAALAPARVRDDEDLLALVSELSSLVERDRVADDERVTIETAVRDLALLVEQQSIERRLGEIRAQLSDDDADDELLAESMRLRKRVRELNPRLAEGR